MFTSKGELSMKLILSTAAAVLLSSALSVSASEDFVCDNDGKKRIVSIVYQNEETPVPCEVRYDKGEGEQTLWTAQSEVGFCEARANEFMKKQESLGWSCEKFEVPAFNEALKDLHTSVY